MKKVRNEATDNENPELTEAFFKRAKKGEVFLRERYGAKADSLLRSPGRPRTDHPKPKITIRLDPQVLEAYKATGKGWQTRMQEILSAHAPKN
jgi:uncharacterized protein (DUF4415 family)